MSEQLNSSLLALARQQIFDEYIKAKADDLAEWLIACDKQWKEDGTMLPYPTFSFYPSEEDIIARAKLLSGASEEPTVETVEPEAVEEVKEEVIAETEKPPVKVYYKQKRKWKK